MIFAAAGADEAGEAENLAAPQVEADVLEVDAGKAAHVENDVARRGCGIEVLVDFDFAARHQGEQPLLVHAGDGEMADQLAVAQHGDLVADLEDFFRLVRDEDDPFAFVAQGSDDAEQPLDLVDRERRGRLVEDEDVEPRGERRLWRSSELLIGDGELARLLIRAAADAETVELLLRLFGRRRALMHAAAETRLLERHEQVFGDGEMGEEAELLRHVTDALEQLRRSCSTGRPSTRTSPSLGNSVPVRILTSVDLPAPFSPATTWTAPGLIAIETSESAFTPG